MAIPIPSNLQGWGAAGTSSASTALTLAAAGNQTLIACAAVSHATTTPTKPTFSGAGLTWTEIADYTYETGVNPRLRITVWWANAAAGFTSQAFTVSSAGAAVVAATLSSWIDIDTAAGFSNKNSATSTVGDPALTLGAVASDSAVYTAACGVGNGAFGMTGYTGLGSFNPTASFTLDDRYDVSSPSTTLTRTSTNTYTIGLGIEFKAVQHKFSFVTGIGTGNSKTGTTISAAVPLSTTIAAGSLVVVAIGSDNAGTTDAAGQDNIASVTDSVGGNTWTFAAGYRNGQGTAQTGAHASIWYSKLTNALPTNATITVTNSTSAYARAMSAAAYTPATGILSVAGSAGAAGDAGVDPSAVISGLASDEYLWVGCAADETTGIPSTTITGFTATLGAATSGGSANLNMGVRQYWAIETATGKTFTPATTTDAAAVLVAFKVTTGVTGNLAATETGEDTAALDGVVVPLVINGTLDATETGSDTASITDVGGAALIPSKADGFAVDFISTYTDKMVAVKTSHSVVEYAAKDFIGNAGLAPKLVYNSSGVLDWPAHNLVVQSEDFTSASWVKTNTPVVTAHSIEDNNAAALARLDQTVICVIGQAYAITLWVLKDAVTTRFPAFNLVGTGSYLLSLNTSTGATSVPTNTYASASHAIEDLGTHWKVVLTFVAMAGSTSLRTYPAYSLTLGGGSNNTAVGTITIDKAQWNKGSAPCAYLPTTTTANGGLAFDHDPISLQPHGLLCEAAATNLLLNNATLSTQSVTVTAVAHTLSFWGTGTITLSGVSTAGPLVGTGANDRVKLTFTPTAGSLTLTVSGTVTLAQLETGLYATSPIPTFGVAVARAVNQYNVAPASIGYSSTAGSWWALVDVINPVSGVIVQVGATSASPLYYGATAFALTSGSNLGKTVPGGTGGRHKVASAYQTGDRAITADGLTVAADAGSVVNLLTPTTVYLGSSGAGTPVTGYLRKVYYLPERMLNTELVSETVLGPEDLDTIVGNLAATESGADVAELTGVVPVAANLAAVETGPDLAELTGTIPVTITLAATESGEDTSYFDFRPPVSCLNVGSVVGLNFTPTKSPQATYALGM